MLPLQDNIANEILKIQKANEITLFPRSQSNNGILKKNTETCICYIWTMSNSSMLERLIRFQTIQHNIMLNKLAHYMLCLKNDI